MSRQVEDNEPGPLTIMFEAVEKNNPRGFNRKVMKTIRKCYRKFKKVEQLVTETGKLLREAAE